MKKYIFAAAILLVSLISFNQAPQASAQTPPQCPAGYTCTILPQQPSNCPAGYTCAVNLVPSASTGSCYQFSSNLNLGSTGADVVALQTFLLANGFNIPAISSGAAAKGYYGISTAAALSKYQTSVGLTQNGLSAEGGLGVFGPTTRSKVNACGTTTVTPVCPPGFTCTTPPNPSLTATVTGYYLSYLGRQPDAAGLSYWVNTGLSASQILQGMMAGIEYQTRLANITQLYVTLLNRQPDAAGLAYYANNGLTISQIQQSILSSQEYANLHSNTSTSNNGSVSVSSGSAPTSPAAVTPTTQANINGDTAVTWPFTFTVSAGSSPVYVSATPASAVTASVTAGTSIIFTSISSGSAIAGDTNAGIGIAATGSFVVPSNASRTFTVDISDNNSGNANNVPNAVTALTGIYYASNATPSGRVTSTGSESLYTLPNQVQSPAFSLLGSAGSSSQTNLAVTPGSAPTSPVATTPTTLANINGNTAVTWQFAFTVNAASSPIYISANPGTAIAITSDLVGAGSSVGPNGTGPAAATQPVAISSGIAIPGDTNSGLGTAATGSFIVPPNASRTFNVNVNDSNSGNATTDSNAIVALTGIYYSSSPTPAGTAISKGSESFYTLPNRVQSPVTTLLGTNGSSVPPTPPSPQSNTTSSSLTATVTGYYVEYLARQPDAAGLSYWVNTGLSASQILNGIMAGSEYQTRLANITQLYVTLLNRQPDSAGLTYYANNGLTISQIQQSILGSQEYANLHSGTASSTALSASIWDAIREYFQPHQ